MLCYRRLLVSPEDVNYVLIKMVLSLNIFYKFFSRFFLSCVKSKINLQDVSWQLWWFIVHSSNGKFLYFIFFLIIFLMQQHTSDTSFDSEEKALPNAINKNIIVFKKTKLTIKSSRLWVCRTKLFHGFVVFI